jgi:hypothetical protein
MLENPCLRPASLSDVSRWEQTVRGIILSREREMALERLYNFEWAKRGFAKSP